MYMCEPLEIVPQKNKNWHCLSKTFESLLNAKLLGNKELNEQTEYFLFDVKILVKIWPKWKIYGSNNT